MAPRLAIAGLSRKEWRDFGVTPGVALPGQDAVSPPDRHHIPSIRFGRTASVNPNLASDLATRHIRDLQRAALERRAAVERRPALEPPRALEPPKAAVHRGHHPSALRRQLGFTLVEAGLHLLADRTDTGHATYS